MAYIRGSDLKRLAANITDSDVVMLEIDEASGKVNVAVMPTGQSSGGCSGCGTCETPCDEKAE